MLAVRAADVVVLVQGRDATCRTRLLAYVQVAEPADLSGCICLLGFLLKAPEEEHIAHQAERYIRRNTV